MRVDFFTPARPMSKAQAVLMLMLYNECIYRLFVLSSMPNFFPMIPRAMSASKWNKTRSINRSLYSLILVTRTGLAAALVE